MMQQGVFVLVMMLQIGEGTWIYKDYQTFPNWQVCNAWKDRTSEELRVPMTCVEVNEHEL